MTDFRGQFTPAQRDILLEPIKPHRVARDNKGMAYVEGYEIQAHLNRIFGFEGWDKELIKLELLFEKNENERCWVTYLCELRLTIRTTEGVIAKVVEEAGTGSAQNQPSRGDAHDLALKSAITDALKRCAKDLGDQFGLSLYKKGSMEALVKRVIPYEEEPAGD
jgi:recombination DNA repair RAD52 pathway protein